MALTFKDLTIGEIYPIYVVKGNKVETKRFKPTKTSSELLLCLFMDKLGRQTHGLWGSSCSLTVWNNADMLKSSLYGKYFLNKEDALRQVINKLKNQKQEINKKIMNVLKELNINKGFYFDE